LQGAPGFTLGTPIAHVRLTQHVPANLYGSNLIDAGLSKVQT